MTQEEKQLLLKDLCARLPYGVKVQPSGSAVPHKFKGYDKGLVRTDTDQRYELENIKPYLRPMSNMTEEEFELLKQYSGLEFDQLNLAEFPNNHKCLDFYLEEIPSYIVILVFDWLNAHHFDYRGLIPMGLALEAPEDMYKTEQNFVDENKGEQTSMA